jgi:hypothetical protein
VSHDGIFIVRSDGRDQYYYDRWAALQIDRMLLTGPDEALVYVGRLHETETLCAFTFTCVAVMIDRDRKQLLYWANQFAGRSFVTHRYYRLMLDAIWAGWTTRWAMRGARDFAEALALELEGLDRTPHITEPRSLEQLRADHAVDWEGFCATMSADELAKAIADCGEDVVRSWAGPWDASGWVTTRDADGRLRDYLVEDLYDHLLQQGHRLIDYLREARPLDRVGSLVREDCVRQTAFIDVAARRIDWWWVIPHWLFPWRAGDLWPGWSLVQHDGGPRHHMALGDRGLDEIRCSAEESFAEISETFQRMLTAEFDPLRWLAQAARHHAGPDTTVTIEHRATRIEPVGTVSGGPSAEAVAALRALIAAHP